MGTVLATRRSYRGITVKLLAGPLLAAWLALALAPQTSRAQCPPGGLRSALARLDPSSLFEADPRQLKIAFDNSRAETLAWREYQADKFAGQKVHVVHQLDIKALNETIWNSTGTEAFLEEFNREIHALLREHPKYGKIIQSRYKNHWVVSPLDDADFERLVLAPVREKAAQWLRQRIPDSVLAEKTGVPGAHWESWLGKTLVHDSGQDVLDAHFKMGIRLANSVPEAAKRDVNYASWRVSAVARRARLAAAAAEARVPWNDLLTELHTRISRKKGDIDSFTAWMSKRGMGKWTPEAIRYLDDLQMGDFFPFQKPFDPRVSADGLKSRRKSRPLEAPRGNWQLERRVAFANGATAQQVFVTDVEGLGRIGRIAQDRWIASGARLEDLPKNYAETTAAMDMITGQIYRGIREIVGHDAPISVYRHLGDDLVWFLPKPADPAVQAKLQGYLDAVTSRYHPIGTESWSEMRMHRSSLHEVGKPDDPRSIGEALLEARAALDQAKQARSIDAPHPPLPVWALVKADRVRFSHEKINPGSAGGRSLPELVKDLQAKGWDHTQALPRVVAWPDGKFEALDQRRLVAARMAGMEFVPAEVHRPDELLPPDLKSEIQLHHPFALPDGSRYLQGQHPRTWGEAVLFQSLDHSKTGQKVPPHGFSTPKADSRVPDDDPDLVRASEH